MYLSLQKWKIEQAWPIEQSPVGAEQVLQELGNCVEERRAPRDGFGAAESLWAHTMLRFCDLVLCWGKVKRVISACSRGVFQWCWGALTREYTFLKCVHWVITLYSFSLHFYPPIQCCPGTAGEQQNFSSTSHKSIFCFKCVPGCSVWSRTNHSFLQGNLFH